MVRPGQRTAACRVAGPGDGQLPQAEQLIFDEKIQAGGAPFQRQEISHRGVSTFFGLQGVGEGVDFLPQFKRGRPSLPENRFQDFDEQAGDGRCHYDS